MSLLFWACCVHKEGSIELFVTGSHRPLLFSAMHLAVWVGSPWPHTCPDLRTRTCRNFDSHDCHGTSLRWDTEEAMEHEPLQGLGSMVIRPLLVGTSLSSMIDLQACSVFPLLCKVDHHCKAHQVMKRNLNSSLRCPTRTTNTLAFSSPSVCTAASACRSGIATTTCALCGQTLDRWDDHAVFGVWGEIALRTMAPPRMLCCAPRMSVRSLQSSKKN